MDFLFFIKYMILLIPKSSMRLLVAAAHKNDAYRQRMKMSYKTGPVQVSGRVTTDVGKSPEESKVRRGM